MRCVRCAWENQSGVAFCTNCGQRLEGNDAPQTSAQESVEAGESVVVRRAEDLGLSATVITPSSAGSDSPPAESRGELDVADYGSEPVEAPSDPSRVCPACESVNAPGMRFCGECGAGLQSATASPLPAVETEGRLSPSLQASPAVGDARLITLRKDGTEGRAIHLDRDRIDLGRSEGEVTFDDDAYLSPRHARIERVDGSYQLTDLDSVNGIYIRIRADVALRDRDMVLLGQQVLRFERLDESQRTFGAGHQRGVMVFGTPDVARYARLVRVSAEGVGRDTYYLFRDETILGRENGDIVFTDDPFLSRKHAAIRVDDAGERFTLHDLGSSNGTAMRLRSRVRLRSGDEFRMGRHLFRFELLGDEAPR